MNPNDTEHALSEIERCVARGAVGIKLLASRRADDPLLDPICRRSPRERGLPMLHHIWQHRTREWPDQEISDGADLARLAARHPRVSFILAHIGGGGDYAHTLRRRARHARTSIPICRAAASIAACSTTRSPRSAPTRLLWGCDLTM